MEIVQFVEDSLGDASYLLISDGVAAVIDPQRDVRRFTEFAESRGARIAYAFETHVHNDYLSGGRELAERGATIVAPAEAGLEFPHRAIAEGDEVVVGKARVRAVVAPGHTYEHTAYLALDEDGVVRGAFTGGSLLVGSAGRTDLLGPDHTEELTRLQWESIRRLAGLLPGDAEVLPTHGAGSFCSSGEAGGQRRSRLNVERERNMALSAPDFEAFRDGQLSYLPPTPGYYPHMAPINRRGPKIYGAPPAPRPVTPDELTSLASEHVRVVDVRTRTEFAAGHVPGSILIEQSGSMLAYFGWMVPFNAALALVARGASQADEVTRALFLIGYEDVRGFLQYDRWLAAGRETETLDAVSLEDAQRALQTRERPVLDVRFRYEHELTPLPGAIQRPVDGMRAWTDDLPREPLLVICQSGQRAAMAASVLAAQGRRDVAAVLDGGADDLRAMIARSARAGVSEA